MDSLPWSDLQLSSQNTSFGSEQYHKSPPSLGSFVSRLSLPWSHRPTRTCWIQSDGSPFHTSPQTKLHTSIFSCIYISIKWTRSYSQGVNTTASQKSMSHWVSISHGYAFNSAWVSSEVAPWKADFVRWPTPGKHRPPAPDDCAPLFSIHWYPSLPLHGCMEKETEEAKKKKKEKQRVRRWTRERGREVERRGRKRNERKTEKRGRQR